MKRHDRTRTVRTAQHADMPTLLKLYRHLNADDPALPPERATALWSDLLHREGLFILLAEQDTIAVATCTLVIVPNLTRGGRPYALIENVVTHADFRGQGHGRAILAAALGKAWQADCYKVMLLTGRKDDAIRSFYEGAGFRSDVKIGFHASPSLTSKGRS